MNPITTPAAPTTLDWTAALSVGDARMDDTHEEFVSMLNQLLAATPTQQVPLYRAFIEHTVEHFAQEERWMLATGFSADNCHAGHHATILETMNAVLEHSKKAMQASSSAWLKRCSNGFRSTLPAWTPAWPST